MSIAELLAGYPGLVPGLILSAVAAAALGGRVGRLFDAPPVHGAALMIGLGLAISATLTPGGDVLAEGALGTGACDLSRIGFATWNQISRVDEVALNLLLLAPLGVALGLLPGSRAKAAGVVLAYVLPIAIEGIQLVAVPLARACQSGDVIDNMTGLTVGILVGAAARWLAEDRTDGRPPRLSVRAAIVGVVGVAVLGIFAATFGTSTGPRALLPLPTPVSPEPSASFTPSLSPTKSVRVTSIPDLLDALADDSLSEIVVADGTYPVSPAADKAADSLWIGDRFAGREQPVTVRAETPGGVTFDGGGAAYYGGITFVEGAHHQTWQGFVFANGTPTSTGVIVFGGYEGEAAPHHITLLDLTLPDSLTSSSTGATDHGVYFSRAVDGPHDIVIDGLVVDGGGGLDSALHFFGSDEQNVNAWNVTVRRLQVRGTEQAIILWDPTIHDVTIDTATIVDPRDFAVRFEAPGATGIQLSNIISTGSGSGQGFHSTMGPTPPGVTFTNASLR